MRGEAIYLFAFDIAYELIRPLPAQLLGQPVVQFNVNASRRNPRQLLFYKPEMVRLPVEERVGPRGPVLVETVVKILPIGAISIAIRVPFAVTGLYDLDEFHDVSFANASLADEARTLAGRVLDELRAYAVRPAATFHDEEPYTVFCLRSPVAGFRDAAAWLDQHRAEVASLLTQEIETPLAAQEVAESTSRALSYFEDDLLVIDWEAALLVDEPADAAETLHVIELANLQLAELEAYDRHLDEVLERSYRDVRGQSVRRRREIIRELRELQIDLTRFHDELSNITKFFGDWHLARVYESVAARFHLEDWHRTVERKLRTLGELHELLKSEQSSRWMMILEATIVLLFVIDIVMLFLGLKR